MVNNNKDKNYVFSYIKKRQLEIFNINSNLSIQKNFNELLYLRNEDELAFLSELNRRIKELLGD